MNSVILLLMEERVNTNINFYICRTYKYEKAGLIAYFKFYVSFPEAFQVANVDTDLMENQKIVELESQKIESKTLHNQTCKTN